jgi:hypothetical protein
MRDDQSENLSGRCHRPIPLFGDRLDFQASEAISLGSSRMLSQSSNDELDGVIELTPLGADARSLRINQR